MGIARQEALQTTYTRSSSALGCVEVVSAILFEHWSICTKDEDTEGAYPAKDDTVQNPPNTRTSACGWKYGQPKRPRNTLRLAAGGRKEL